MRPQIVHGARHRFAVLSCPCANGGRSTPAARLPHRRRNGATTNVQTLHAYESFLTVTNLQTSATYSVVVTNATRPAGVLSANAVITVLADTDGDGLPDAWETEQGLNPNSAHDRDADNDGDGMTNWQEYIAGTDPIDPASYLSVASPSVGSGGVALEFGAVSNKTYTVQTRNHLGNAPWVKLTDIVARPTNHVEAVEYPNSVPLRFYRVVTPRQP